MIYREVFQLAQEKGYKKGDDAYFKALFNQEGVLIELILIQKYLRDEKKMGIIIHLSGENKYYWRLLNLSLTSDRTINTRLQYHDSYEEALLNAINEALKLI